MGEEGMQLTEELTRIFTRFDDDGSDELNKEEFEDLMSTSEGLLALQSIGIQPAEAAGLFDLLDQDGSGAVGLQEFISNCIRLHGDAKAVDVVTILYENKKIAKKLEELKRLITGGAPPLESPVPSRKVLSTKAMPSVHPSRSSPAGKDRSV